MKIEVYGKVVAVQTATNKNGELVTYVELQEGDQFVNNFKVMFRNNINASVCQPGAVVLISGYGNGRKVSEYKNAQGAMVPLKFPRFETYFTASKVEVKKPALSTDATPIAPSVPEGGTDEIPW